MKKKVIFLILFLIVAITLLGFYFSPNHCFMRLADDYFDNFYLPDNPTIATAMGLHQYDDKLDDYSAAGIKRRITQLKKYETQFENFNSNYFSEEIKGDRELILGNIRSQLLTLETIRPWQKNPDSYSSGITSSAFVLMSRKFAPLNDRLRSLIAREKLMPAALAAARENLKNPPAIYTGIALEQLPGLIAFFRDALPAVFMGADDALKKEFAKTNAAVITALQEYQTWLFQEILPVSTGDFRIGAEVFRKKLLYDEMVDTPLEKLLEIDIANMQQNQQEFIRVAKQISPNQSPQQVLAALKADHPAPNQLLEKFRGTFAGLIRFIKESEIITIPSDVEPIVEESPPFLRAITFASMDTPGPFEKTAQEAYFNVTLPDPRWDAKRINEFMMGFNYPVINNIAVHEAYPGHYVQYLWVHDKVKDRVRKLLGATSNIEGWAHYCEQMMLDQGLGKMIAKNQKDADLLRLGQLQNALLRNARFLVGIKMHTGQMSFEEAVKFFEKEGYQSHTVALVEAKRGTVDPTYLYYTLGKLEILKLRKDVQAKLGSSFNLQTFHDNFMRQGYPPIKIVRQAMLRDNSAVL